MALVKTPTTLISNATLTTSGTNTSASSLDLSGATDFAIGFQATFNASAASGIRIELFADPAAAYPSFAVGSYDDPVDSYDIAVDAGHIVKGVLQFNRSAKYVKVKVTNLSSTYTVTGVYIYGIVQAQS